MTLNQLPSGPALIGVESKSRFLIGRVWRGVHLILESYINISQSKKVRRTDLLFKSGADDFELYIISPHIKQCAKERLFSSFLFVYSYLPSVHTSPDCCWQFGSSLSRHNSQLTSANLQR